MWSSIANKCLALVFLCLPALARGAGPAFWSAAFVHEPYFLEGAFHPTLQAAGKLDIGKAFRAQTRLSFSGEAYGLFEPERDPRAWESTFGALGGFAVPHWPGDLEVSAGIGAVVGRKQGQLFFRHEWDGGVFAEETREYRKRVYADAGIPFQVQWLFSKRRRGLGLAYSGFLSRELTRWGIGFYLQGHLGAGPSPKPDRSGPPSGPIPPSAPPPGDAGTGAEEMER